MVTGMPYELAFTKKVGAPDPDRYINECCVGGDMVAERLLPSIRERYEDVQFEQEDWGWFIWFRKGPVRLAVDIFCDNPEEGRYRIHLTSRKKKWLLFDAVENLSELEELKALVTQLLDAWAQAPCRTTLLDRKYDPVG